MARRRAVRSHRPSRAARGRDCRGRRRRGGHAALATADAARAALESSKLAEASATKTATAARLMVESARVDSVDSTAASAIAESRKPRRTIAIAKRLTGPRSGSDRRFIAAAGAHNPEFAVNQAPVRFVIAVRPPSGPAVPVGGGDRPRRLSVMTVRHPGAWRRRISFRAVVASSVPGPRPTLIPGPCRRGPARSVLPPQVDGSGPLPDRITKCSPWRCGYRDPRA